MTLPWKRESKERNADELGKLFATVFHGDKGEAALEHLMGMTMDQALGPNSTNEHLRHLEGQRFMVKYIINLVERGRK